MRAFLAEKGVARQYWPERLEVFGEFPARPAASSRSSRSGTASRTRREHRLPGHRDTHPIGRYGGALAPVRPDDLAAHVLGTLTAMLPSVDWAAVDDVVLGCANQAGEDNRNVARMAVLLAGLPVQVPAGTVNRLCVPAWTRWPSRPGRSAPATPIW